VIGQVTSRFRVAVERAPVAKFAESVLDRDPGYLEPKAPVPPTFPFAARYWGAHPALQVGLEPVDSDPVGEVLGGLMAGGGLILHGEQSYEYHRPVVVGDVLLAESRLADLYEKESKGRTMTFLVIETLWTDDATGQLVLTERTNLIHRS
jgi:peroxisomal enoyl-CoA hydratase 2